MRTPIVLLLGSLALSGCGESEQPRSGAARADIVASIHPVAAIIRELAPEGTRVAVLLPPGAHADTYEPTPRMAEAVEGAALIVKVGGGLDDWVGTPGPGGRVLVLAEGVPLRKGDGHRGTGNPHIWLDPVLVRDRLLPRLAAALVGLAPGDSAAIHARAAAFADSLTALDVEIGAVLAEAPTRRFVAAHPAWTYFADRYGLEEVGVLHPSPGEEIGTRALALLIEEARARGVRAVIAEPQLARAGVSALAAELNVNVEVGDAVGGAGVESRDGYLELMRWNARAFARALGSAP